MDSEMKTRRHCTGREEDLEERDREGPGRGREGEPEPVPGPRPGAAAAAAPSRRRILCQSEARRRSHGRETRNPAGLGLIPSHAVDAAAMPAAMLRCYLARRR
jgi:hypothetical protein